MDYEASSTGETAGAQPDAYPLRSEVGTVGEAGNAPHQALQSLRRRLPTPRRHLKRLEIVRGDPGVVKDALGGRAPTRLEDGKEECVGRRRLRGREGGAPDQSSLHVVGEGH